MERISIYLRFILFVGLLILPHYAFPSAWVLSDAEQKTSVAKNAPPVEHQQAKKRAKSKRLRLKLKRNRLKNNDPRTGRANKRQRNMGLLMLFAGSIGIINGFQFGINLVLALALFGTVPIPFVIFLVNLILFLGGIILVLAATKLIDRSYIQYADNWELKKERVRSQMIFFFIFFAIFLGLAILAFALTLTTPSVIALGVAGGFLLAALIKTRHLKHGDVKEN
ncbi:MAG: hypothetical protein MK212_11095 [Saprospiraceae bacterium]|nr:hypothetical protein [Saprospiraceae bacterium]